MKAYKCDGWISVKDCLPEPYEDVILYDDKVWFGFYQDDLQQWYMREDIGTSTTVTHWMPLPKSPRNGETTKP